MATKEGDADLFSDDFNTPGWENDDPPWTPHNIPGVAGAHADQVTGSELSLGFTDTGEVLAWDGTYDAPAVYQTFEPTEGWSVEVKCTGHTLNADLGNLRLRGR
jgi:hypothetical protein